MSESIRLEELPNFTATLSRNLMRNHEKRFADRIKSIKRSSDGLAAVADKLDVSIRNAWGSLDKATSEQGLRLTQTIRDTTQQLSNQEAQYTYKDSDSYHEIAVEASNKIIFAIRRYVPKLHKTLKTDIASLNSALAKFEASINSLGTTLDESPGSTLESVEADARILLEKDHALKELRSQNVMIQESISKEADNEKAVKAELDSLLSNEEFRRLEHYEDSLKTKEGEIDQFLQPLVKPLRKFERTQSTDDLSQPEQMALAKLIEAPKKSVLEIDPQTLLQVLNALAASLLQGEFQIEDRKRRRVEEVIIAAKKGELGKLRQSYTALENEIRYMTSKLTASGLIHKRSELTRRLTETQSRTSQLNMQLSDKKRQVDEMTKAISKQKATVESRITKLSGEQVDVKVEL